MYPRTNSWLYVKPEHKPGFHDFGFLPTMLFAFLKQLFACKNSVLWPHESLLENYLSQCIYIYLPGYKINKRLTQSQKEQIHEISFCSTFFFKA